MTDYSQLSDFEINKMVGSVTGEATLSEPIFNQVIRNSTGKEFNPCNNPADAWPIVFGHKLSLINADDEWLCVSDDTVIDGVTGDDVRMIYSSDGRVHANPLRAAMIVFLMMQEKSK